MSNISKKAKEKPLKPFGNHSFLSRITKTLYYGKLPKSDRLSLPVTELATELFSEAKVGRSLERLHCYDAASISRNACVSPCSFILAMLYLERLKSCNSDYLQRVNPSELFLVSLMVSSKFLYDDGEEDEVFMKDWAASGGLSVQDLVRLEKEFLNEINWEIFVNETTFWKKLNDLETTLARREGKNRGWFTYSELTNILTTTEVYHLYQYIASLVMVLLATYTAGVITVISSMYIVSQIPGNSLQTSTRNTLVTGGGDAPILHTKMCQDVDSDTHIDLGNLTELNCDLYRGITKKQINATDVLTTGLILASIKPVPTNKSDFYDEESGDNNEKISWDWWSSPSMVWLTKTSELVQTFDLLPNFRGCVYCYADSAVVAEKIREGEDQVHKATKTRIQDQLERSWHEEWIDTISDVMAGKARVAYDCKNLNMKEF